MEIIQQNFKFKTNINCSGCVAAVKPQLDNAEGILQWDVDTTNKEKILTVRSEGITEQQVIDTIKKAGYKAETVNQE